MSGIKTNLKNLNQSFEKFKTMLTAAEANALFEASKHDLAYIYTTIEIMAKGSSNYATLSIEKIKEPQEYKKQLEENGYKVEISEKYFNVTW